MVAEESKKDKDGDVEMNPESEPTPAILDPLKNEEIRNRIKMLQNNVRIMHSE